MPISSSSISPNSKGGFDIKDQAAKYVADMGSETQVNLFFMSGNTFVPCFSKKGWLDKAQSDDIRIFYVHSYTF